MAQVRELKRSMNPIKVVIKNFIKYTIIVFLVYLLIVNADLTVQRVIEGFIKSLCLAALLVPLTLTNYFSPLVAKNSEYKRTISFDRDFKETFKQIRTLLKTMNDIEIYDSDKDKGEIHLESTFSKLYVEIKPVEKKDDEEKEKVEITIKSIPKVYDKLQDYDKFTRDVKNIVSTIELNLEPDKYNEEDLFVIETEADYIEEFKPMLILYFRLIKLWLITILTTCISVTLYYFAFNMMPDISTIVFFFAVIVYIFYLFINEVNKTSKLIVCPSCKTELITVKHNIFKYNIPVRCISCNQKLLGSSNKSGIMETKKD